MTDILVYITGHGFGHAVPTLEVVKALNRSAPDLFFHINTAASEGLLKDAGVLRNSRYVHCRNDVGTVQQDWFRLDKEATLRQHAELIAQEAAFVAGQLDYVRANNIRLILANIPPAAFTVAAQARVPGIALGSFSWDWIYAPFIEEYPRYAYVVDHIRAAYGRADLLLRFPFCGDMSAFPVIEDIPMIARKSAAERPSVLGQLGLAETERRKIVLCSFGGFTFAPPFLEGVKECRDYLFVWCGDVPNGFAADNIIVLPQHAPIPHQDLVKTCDVVVTKPGIGIVSECIANRTPIVYTSRDDFVEYDVLVRGLERYAHAHFMPRDELLAGNWGPHLDRVMTKRYQWPPLRTDGADVAAARILERLRHGYSASVASTR